MKVRDLKKGMIVYECESGNNARLEVLEDAHRDIGEKRDGHSCLVRCGEREFELFQDLTCHAYGPRLYAKPQYIGGRDFGFDPVSNLKHAIRST